VQGAFGIFHHHTVREIVEPVERYGRCFTLQGSIGELISLTVPLQQEANCPVTHAAGTIVKYGQHSAASIKFRT
jgi:hypothetical protein